MEKTGKGKVVIIIILLVISLGLVGYLGYHITVSDKEKVDEIRDLKKEIEGLKVDNKELKSNNKTSDKKVNYTLENMEGEYIFKSESKKDENGNEYSTNYKLTLNKNGLFKYTLSELYESGIIGNYFIEDDKLILNYVFHHGNDAALDVLNKNSTIKGSYTLKISDKNTIVESNPKVINSREESKQIKLIKNESNQIENIQEMLDNYGIFNSQHRR